MVDITLSPDGGREVRGYLATPDGAGPWPGVVVLHEVFGLTGDIRRQADRFAQEGYLAFAPDLYTRGPRIRCVRRAFRELLAGSGQTFENIEASRRVLGARDDCSGKVGVIGFCMGGGFALVAAARYDFDVASVNYGALPRDAERVLQGVCPIVASYGKKDISLRGKAAELDRTLTELGMPHDVKEYPGVGHSFLGEYRTGSALTVLRRVAGMRHDPEVAADAWRRIFAFFDEYLNDR
jgi:carboxymethylenebutenolidase